MNKELHHIINIGAYMEEKLYDAGIYDEVTLRKLGSKEAFLRMRKFDDSLCIRVLYGLEGAIQGIKDSALSKADKEDLLNFFRTLQK